MKNSIKLTFSFLALCLLILSSCSKEAPLQPEATVNDPVPTANSESQICFDNPNNPYEYAGEQHNLGLDALAATPNSSNLSLEEAHAIALQSVSSNSGVDMENNFEFMQEAYEDFDNEDPMVHSAQLLLENDLISTSAYDKIVELDQIIGNSEGPAPLGNAVLSFENDILQENSFTTFELEVLLGASSIARHSSCYWSNVYLNPDHPFHAKLVGENGLQGSIDARWGWGWIKKKIRKIIRRDVAGYKYGMRTVWKWRWVFGLGWILVRTYKSIITGIIWSFG